MPPKKNTKTEEKVKETKETVVKENKLPDIKEKKEVKKTTKVVKEKKEQPKGKKTADKLSEKAKWAEVTDDNEQQDEHEDVNIEEESQKSETEESSSESDEEEMLVENIKTVTEKINKIKNNKSVTDFDYEEIFELDQEELSDYDTNTLLKVLMVRGTKTNNPILWGKCKTLLQILNFELKPTQPQRNKKHYNNRNHNVKQEQSFDEKQKVNPINDDNSDKKVSSNWRRGKGGKNN